MALLRVTLLFALTPLTTQGQEVIRSHVEDGMIHGTVFADQNEDGRHDCGEPGIDGVLVSNGWEVIVTNYNGRYALPFRGDMYLTVVQPSGWRVPVDEKQVPQFSYTHKPGGTPESLRCGGLPDTGPVPRRSINASHDGIRFCACDKERAGVVQSAKPLEIEVGPNIT